MTLLGSILFLTICCFFIFFVAKGCVAAQESTQVRKYVTSADSTLSDSANLGREELQGALVGAAEDPASMDAGALSAASDKARTYYLDALHNQEVPPGFEDAHHYVVSSLGIRSEALENLSGAVGAEPAEAGEALAASVEDFKLSDAIIRDHYVPSSEDALEASGRRGDRSYLYEPEPFMDYEALGLETEAAGAASATSSDPNALHGVEIFGVEVGGQPLYAGGNAVLTGSAEPIFLVTVTNSGEVPETGVPVEVVLNTIAERQALSARVERIEPGGSATVEVGGFKPGQLNETAEATVSVGPVEYEQNEDNNALTGTVTFGL
ncbi:hypothetical protein GBA65_00185 [Rubrobacter marinus]|uniref:CARDB domain-containing protein n=1 Tax=Rubrobacter marinus TaxID=2653852 RepID=A0A6G8PRY6_9ACTN|nr:hypothetical protein [Rubrobacter marinus]QIN77190.1 hypothetical protein GBA65_00185 [Rubrobacter marinus]